MGRRGPIPASSSGGSGGTSPSGTGFTHNTAGSQDAASVALTFTGDTTGTGTGASIALTTVKVNGAAVSAAGALTTGNGPYVSGLSALTYSALNLAGGTGWVTGALPLGNQAAPTSTGLAKVSAGAWVGAAALLVNADVDTAAAIAASKVVQATGTGYVHVTAGALDVASTGITFTGDTTGTGTGASIALTTVALTGAGGTLPLASTAAIIQWASTTTAPTISMATHATTPQAMTVQAANVTTGTGSGLALTSGTGSVAAGNVSLQTGGTTQLLIAPTLLSVTSGNALAFLGSSNVAATGKVRFANATQDLVVVRNNVDSADWAILQQTGATRTSYGNNNMDCDVIGASISLTSNSNIITLTSNSALTVTANMRVGLLSTAMADADKTVSAANCRVNQHIFTGANTGVRAVTFNVTPTNGTIKFIRNNCTSFGITVQFSTGAATATIPPGTSAVVCADGTNAVILMSGT